MSNNKHPHRTTQERLEAFYGKPLYEIEPIDVEEIAGAHRKTKKVKP